MQKSSLLACDIYTHPPVNEMIIYRMMFCTGQSQNSSETWGHMPLDKNNNNM